MDKALFCYSKQSAIVNKEALLTFHRLALRLTALSWLPYLGSLLVQTRKA